ncbi:LPD1 domain-containing protein [Butyrivibrio proteoclasticus]|uniref:LPD1 domain-containing protein n=1 Tax=Butyrivibrio proteoclasticus TaxID=43305 RepID=UPI00047BAC07|nr:LPD1 domain-containing protein [Butyrivibrio proteoclasticus]
MAKKIDWTIEGQINLFTYFDEIQEAMKKEEAAKNVLAKKPISFKSRKEKILQSADEYLKKGERLTTLAKERYGEMMKELSFSDIEEKLFSIKVNGYDISSTLVPKIATTVVRPILKSTADYSDESNAIKMLKSVIDYDFSVETVNIESEYVAAVRYLKRKSSELLKITIREEGFKPLVAYGYKNNAHPKNRKNTLFKDGSMLGDVAEILAWLICFTQYTRAMKNDDLRPAIEEKLTVKSYGWDCNKTIMELLKRKSAPRGAWNKYASNIRELYEAQKAPLALPLQYAQRPSKAAIGIICNMLGYDEDEVVELNITEKSCISKNTIYLDKYHKPFCYVLTKDLDKIFSYTDPLNAVKIGFGIPVYHDYLSKLDRTITLRDEENPDFIATTWPQPGGGNSVDRWRYLQVIDMVLELVFDNFKEKVATLNYFKENEKSRAKVYQTKKNIPEKVVKAMQENELNSFFGYVEFDEEVSLDKTSDLIDEFTAFKETYLKSLDTSSVSIRFRKLGNYKAAGLYFPEIGCLCVDIRHPDSLIHEYGHCIDNVVGNKKRLSEEADFYGCYSAYRRAFSTAVLKSDDAKDKLKGKYKSDYYLQRTEVFARCFEMYVVRTLGMTNSICKPDENMGFAYPDDNELMDRINTYFSKLLSDINGESTEQAAA